MITEKIYSQVSIIKTFNDHRIAMSMLIFGLASEKKIIIDDEKMIKTSFPNFKEILNSLEQKLNSYQNKYPVIAIDGTASSGKGTLAKNLSKVFGFDHLDSGILYRIYAYEVLKNKVKEITNIKVNFISSKNLNSYNQNDLRTENVSKIASEIAKNNFVRKQLINIQRNFADDPPNKKGSVIDGRDITSVIILNAEVKFYVDASLDKRAKATNSTKLTDKEYEKIFIDMKSRDHNDKNRQNSPLIKTNDSFFIDTSDISEKEVLDIAIEEIKKKIDFI